MKKKVIGVLLAVAMTLTLAGCGGSDDKTATSEGTEAQSDSETEQVAADDQGSDDTNDSAEAETGDGGSWAIYWYLCGSDLESENGFATTDLQEALSVNLPENVKIVIQSGGASAWQNELMSADSIGRYVIENGDISQVDELEQANMGDPETLASFLSFCNENYPADHKMVVFWDHGGGSTSGAALDENFEGDCLTLPELREAFESTCTPDASDQPYDIIGFDTCLMATVDVAGIFKDIGKYLVASEETEPGTGWAYDGWLGTLAGNTAISPADLGKSICDSFYSACEQYQLEDEITLSVTDLSKMDNVLEKYNNFGDEALLNVLQDTSFFETFGRAANGTERYGVSGDGGSDMADLSDMAAQSMDILPQTSKELIDAIADAVVYQVKGTYKSHANGLSCYYSYSCQPEPFKGYKKGAGSNAFKYYFQYGLTGDVDEKGIEYIYGLAESSETETPPSKSMPKKKTVNKKKLNNHKIDIVDNTAVLDIGGENASLLSDVNFELAILNGDTMVYLGTDNDLESDWENGVFKDNFRGVWGGIDGHLVYMEVVGTNDEYTTYSVPIKLNGEKCNLSVVYNYSAEKFEILGARSEFENGVADKDVKKLKAGDEITTIHYAVDISGDTDDVKEFEMDTFKVTDSTSFDEVELGDSRYAIEFEMMTSDGNRYTSDVALFNVQDGVMEYE